MSDLSDAIRNAFGKVRPKFVRFHGKSGAPDGTLDSNWQGNQYVQIAQAGTGRVTTARVRASVKTAGLPIEIEVDPFTLQRRVTGGDVSGVAYTGGATPGGTGGLSLHAATHYLTGSDPLIVSLEAVDWVRLSPGTVFGHLTIGTGFYMAAGVPVIKRTNSDLNLNSVYPASGSRVYWILLDSSGVASAVDSGVDMVSQITTLPSTTSFIVGYVQLLPGCPLSFGAVDANGKFQSIIGSTKFGIGANLSLISGTVNTVAKFTATHVVGDSTLVDNGATVYTTLPFGIGGAPTTSLWVTGTGLQQATIRSTDSGAGSSAVVQARSDVSCASLIAFSSGYTGTAYGVTLANYLELHLGKMGVTVPYGFFIGSIENIPIMFEVDDTEQLKLTNAGLIVGNATGAGKGIGTINVSGGYYVNGVSISGGSAHVIQDEGTPLTQRANLNFVGAGVTATDDAGNDATVVTIPGSSGIGGSTGSTDNAVLRADGTGGATLQNSLATVDDNGKINIPLGQTYNIDGSPHTHSSVTGMDFLVAQVFS